MDLLSKYLLRIGVSVDRSASDSLVLDTLKKYTDTKHLIEIEGDWVSLTKKGVENLAVSGLSKFVHRNEWCNMAHLCYCSIFGRNIRNSLRYETHNGLFWTKKESMTSSDVF